jgi:hypothetical protein
MRISQPNSGGWNRLNPIQGARNAWDRVSAHPFQSLLSFIGGVAGTPALSRAMNFGFDRYNDSQFSGAANWLNNSTQQQGNQAEAGAWGRPLDGALGAFGPGAPSYPGQGMPTAAAPWWSTPGVAGGWVAPNGIMDFLGNPDQVITPDGTGVSLPISQQPQAQGAKPDWRTDVPRGGAAGEMGIMGQGANGELLIRGTAPFGGNQRYFRNRRWT